ncbi:AraC family transcriptional regulator with amidase-like domain [Pseudonocardia hierapolitana]|uniref:AraC family transcriptional regulator with amidase-like domain n=1 Tax=Pseudonocardia hierapolitana TaxID=1128676 RepID=A0A561T2A1_9PSEU|nr:AraC family transcriptional regulator with amidase-like domain [Pseudonocardia hierapolitana]
MDDATVPRHPGAVDPGSVTLVIFDGYQALDLAGPYDVFAEAGYACSIVALRAGPVRSNMGMPVLATGIAETDPTTADTMIVVGGSGVHAARSQRELVEWIRAAAGCAQRVASVCSGSFLLAEAGLLDGRRVTTHWNEADRLAHEFPSVEVDCKPIFIREGRLWTSAGVTAGMDLALALVEADIGRDAALRVARDLVMYLRRPGNQSQFSVPLWSAQPASDVLRKVVDAIHTNPGGRNTIADLASLAGLSPRHLQRRFTKEIGVPPAAYVERARIEAAQRALAERDDPVESIARRCGFGSAETLRRAFHRLVGIAPSEYRDRFHTAYT